jgi:hypothetical protein
MKMIKRKMRLGKSLAAASTFSGIYAWIVARPLDEIMKDSCHE